MSTRSAIIMRDGNRYRGIYCHWDGYPEGVGAVLLKHYRDDDKIRRLMDLGDISILGSKLEPDTSSIHSFANPQKDVTLAYTRDRGETGTKATTGNTVRSVSSTIGHDGHVYVWDGKWSHNGKAMM